MINVKHQSTNRTRLRFRNDFGRRSESRWLMSCVSIDVRKFITGLLFREKSLTERIPRRRSKAKLAKFKAKHVCCVKETVSKTGWSSGAGIWSKFMNVEEHTCRLHRDEWLFNDANVSCFTSNHKAARFGQSKLLPFSIPSECSFDERWNELGRVVNDRRKVIWTSFYFYYFFQTTLQRLSSSKTRSKCYYVHNSFSDIRILLNGNPWDLRAVFARGFIESDVQAGN